MRLRNLFKLVLVLAVLAGIYFGIRWIKPEPVRRLEFTVRSWWRSPKVQARIHSWTVLTREEGGVSIHYLGVTDQRAEKVRDIVYFSRKELEERFHVAFPETLEVYLIADRDQDVYYETDAKTQIVVSIPKDEDWSPEGFGGRRNHVASIAYAVALWANCFQKSDPDYPETDFGSSVATFLTWNFLIPRIQKEKEDFAWPTPYKYYLTAGPERYAELAASPPPQRVQDHNWGPFDTFWLHFLQRLGAEKIGASLHEACGLMGDHQIDELARRIREETGDSEIAKELLAAASGARTGPDGAPAPEAPPSN